MNHSDPSNLPAQQTMGCRWKKYCINNWSTEHFTVTKHFTTFPGGSAPPTHACGHTIYCVRKKETNMFFCNILYKTQSILMKVVTSWTNLPQSWMMSKTTPYFALFDPPREIYGRSGLDIYKNSRSFNYNRTCEVHLNFAGHPLCGCWARWNNKKERKKKKVHG